MSIYKTLEKSIKINGLTVPVKVELIVEEDYGTDIASDFDSGDKKTNDAYIQRFKDGELFIATLGVKATALGETGTDWLGACHIHSNNYFDSKPFEADVNSTIEEHGMIQNALNELKQIIVNQANSLVKFATVSK